MVASSEVSHGKCEKIATIEKIKVQLHLRHLIQIPSTHIIPERERHVPSKGQSSILN